MAALKMAQDRLFLEGYRLIVSGEKADDLSFEVVDGDRFSITFVHSVNKTPVTDVYEVSDGKIFVVETKYFGFGAGVQSELEEGQTLSYTEDGAMLISGIDREMTDLNYIVGTVSDHVLEIEGEQYSLRDHFGKNAHISFKLK